MLHAVAAFSLIVPLLAGPVAPAPAVSVPDDTRGLSHKSYSVPDRLEHRARGLVAPKDTPPVGTTREWLGLNDRVGYYRKTYTLRGVGTHIEVWVADDIAFPAGDCRSDPVVVTDAQVESLVTEFDTTIYPRETAAFSTPPDRDGTRATLDGDYTGAGDRTVTLVDNVRDDNFFAFPASPTYIAGFFSAQLNDVFDRNVMTIDAYDWKHRSGPNPPDDPAGDLCSSRPARPRLYEGTFAHEWQHLLQQYVDPDEELWINEGLSDYAQTLTGYVDPGKSIHQRGADSHLACFQGFSIVRTRYNTTPRECGGPQNSLNLWNEGSTPSDVLADYGNAYQFMLYLRDRFGAAALTALHRDGSRHGLTAVAAVLPVPLYDVVHDFQTMTLVDKLIRPAHPRFSAASLRSTVNLDNPAAYDRPGAAPNGADYVRLPVRGRDLESVRFTGAAAFPPVPLAWTVSGDALFSGNRSGADDAAVVAVTVGTRDPVLRFRTRYETEPQYDFGYVTVSVDGGRTYATVAGDHTVAGPLGPGVTGSTGGRFVPHAYNLSAYAGKKILLGFRYVTDGSVDAGGWYVDDISVGDRTVDSSLTDFRSATEIVPVPVHHWQVRLIGIAGTTMRQVPVGEFVKLAAFPRVIAVISCDDPTGTVKQYAPYQLRVNGVRQPGGTVVMP